MRGRFTANADEPEWCERRLLARINRYTVKRLRAEIEPVAARDFLRFLLSWQHVDEDARMEGPDALEQVIEQLEGFEAPAGAWEKEILAGRVNGYAPTWLDDRCRSGRVTWIRLRPQNCRVDGTSRRARTHQIDTHCPAAPPARRNMAHALPHGRSSRPQAACPDGCGLHPQARCVLLRRYRCGHRLAENPGRGCAGRAGCPGLMQLGQLRWPARPARPLRRAPAAHGCQAAAPHGLVWYGRCRPVGHCRRRIADRLSARPVWHIARTLLRRYGVGFWRLLEREAERLPPWRELLRAYRRLESRGENARWALARGLHG